MNINLGRVGTVLLILGMVSHIACATTVSEGGQTFAIDPKVAALTKQAGSEAKLEQYNAAIRHFSDALRMKPDNKAAAAIYSWRADAYIRKGELGNGMSDANEAIRLNPHYFGGYRERGIIYRRTGRLDRAIGDYDMAISLNPNLAQLYLSRAIAYGLKGDYTQALRDNTQAIRLNPNESDFYYDRGTDNQALGNLDKAVADYNEAIRRAPRNLRIYCGRASAFEDMGQLDKASADYERVTRLNASDTYDYRFRGDAHFAKGNYKAAALDLQKAVQLSPTDYEALLSLAWFQATCPEEALRNGKEALEKSLRACELSRWQSYDAVETLAGAYAEIGDFEHAVKYETQAINMKGVSALNRKKMQGRLDLYRQHKPYRRESKFKAR